jgi:hypothetical protein
MEHVSSSRKMGFSGHFGAYDVGNWSTNAMARSHLAFLTLLKGFFRVYVFSILSMVGLER